MPFISIFIVNYNTKALVCRCLDSLLQQKNISFEIIVVDNASQDGSVATLQEKYGEHIRLISNEANVGFGRANNLAAAVAKGAYFYLINPDAHLSDPHGLAKLLVFARAHPEAGLVGTRIHEARKKKHWVQAREHYPAEKYLKFTQSLQNLPGEIAWVLGASLFISRQAFEAVHGFDPDFFLYGEETDLCLRLRQAGYKIAYCAEVGVEHISGASEQQVPAKATWLRKQSGFYLFCQKHYDPRDVQRIAKKAYRKAKFKYWIVKIQKFLGKKVAGKLQRLEAILETANKMRL